MNLSGAVVGQTLGVGLPFTFGSSKSRMFVIVGVPSAEKSLFGK